MDTRLIELMHSQRDPKLERDLAWVRNQQLMHALSGRFRASAAFAACVRRTRAGEWDLISVRESQHMRDVG